ncbi:uncharacterized protein TRAVEDRAFT_55916 [Trametes versicolor FP-101664 SS1]|uniref:uncharacterized protein n=1 Tax=Trametes versicolor (strain FP-101664) TaxID=717944 RepID=UPI0004623FDE|nr:uncharacterized protein TRAVEDRAFT_55916 [Trametes versicolor FP-101664 SS1]EIW65369.1 hypothetical protein TRAVEDRAFT_55916 [Trametes versicolor FP-101664 SS1]
MKVFSLFSLLFATLTATSAALVGSGGVPTCTNEQVAYETYIGKDHNVKVSYSQCDEDASTAALAKRQSSNVCGAACNTFCFTPAGGPSASDCNVIADALLYDSQNVGVLFNVSATGTPTNKITMQYGTCLTYFLNQDFSTLVYCRTEWSKLVTWLSTDCAPANNAQGGLCVATDQRWYVQLQHS